MLKNKKDYKYKYLEKNKRIYINKKIIIVSIIILLLVIIAFFIKFSNNTVKTLKIGNNSSSQDVVNYILNINSYEAEINVEINSNKNNNKYKIKQKYENSGIITQEIIEPNNIKGVRITKENDNLRIENTDLNLNIILEKYSYLSDNILDLDSFIENYKNNNDSKFTEKNDELILETVDNSNNKNPKHKKLYIDRKTANPIKMEIKDTNKNSTIYIIYNEVKVNSLN